MSTYDPDEHIETLGLVLIPKDPGQGRLGLYIPRIQAILIHPYIHPHDRRVVLSHEIGHHETGTQHQYACRDEQRRIELECDTIAAKRLITPEDLAGRIIDSQDCGQWAYNLRVNGRMITTRIHNLAHDERQYLERLWAEHHAS